MICKSIYILKVYSIHYTLRWKQNVKKKLLRIKLTLQKMHSFSFSKLQLITVALLIRNSYFSWKTWFISLKLCIGFSIFDSVSFLLNSCYYYFYYFRSTEKNWALPFKIKIIEEPNTVLLPDLWFLSCNKKFENSMISTSVGAPHKLTWRWTF